jgi:hypothetical protein
VATARAALQRNRLAEADAAIAETMPLLEIIEAGLPTSRLREQIGFAQTHLEYESPDSVRQELGPLRAALADLGRLVDIAAAEAHLEQADLQLGQGNGTAADAAMAAAAAALAYPEVDLPLRQARQLLATARSQLAQSAPEPADAALRAAEDELRALSIAIEAPLAQARQSLWSATANAAAGAFEAVKRDIEQALASLERGAAEADEATRREAAKLSDDIRQLLTAMDREQTANANGVAYLWQRTRALSVRNAEYAATRSQRLGEPDSPTAPLIEAKLHVSYSEAELLYAKDPEKAQAELRQALEHLDRALEQATPGNAAEITALRDEATKLSTALKGGSERAAGPLKDRYEHLLLGLGKAIHMR